MKRLIILLLPIIILSFFSCRGQKYDILSYQEKEIEADCTLNGEYKIRITKSAEASSVSFFEPSSLSHFSFTLTKDGLIAKADDLEIPLSKEGSDGICALLSMFSLSDECLVYAGADENGEIFEFSSDMGEYTLTMSEVGVPKRIQISSKDFSFDVVIDAIKLN